MEPQVNDSTIPFIDEKVTFNVGGIKYQTMRSTIMARDHTFLAMLLSRNPSNEIFIDQDGKLFRHIMFWYRFGLLPDYVAAGVPSDLWDAYVEYFALAKPVEDSETDEEALKMKKFSKVLDWMISSTESAWKTNLKARGVFCFGHNRENCQKKYSGPNTIPIEVFEMTPEIFNDNIDVWKSLVREKGAEIHFEYKGSYSTPRNSPICFSIEKTNRYKMYMYVIIEKKGGISSKKVTVGEEDDGNFLTKVSKIK